MFCRFKIVDTAQKPLPKRNSDNVFQKSGFLVAEKEIQKSVVGEIILWGAFAFGKF